MARFLRVQNHHNPGYAGPHSWKVGCCVCVLISNRQKTLPERDDTLGEPNPVPSDMEAKILDRFHVSQLHGNKNTTGTMLLGKLLYCVNLRVLLGVSLLNHHFEVPKNNIFRWKSSPNPPVVTPPKNKTLYLFISLCQLLAKSPKYGSTGMFGNRYHPISICIPHLSRHCR